MSPKIILRMWCSILLLGAEAGGTEELNGILGESVIFKAKASPPFETISWSAIVDNDSKNIALVTFGEPCGLQVPSPIYRNRVTISKDCRELHLSRLEKEDAGRYKAEIVVSTSETKERFDLRVFRRLLDSDLKVTCAEAGSGNWTLNCSTGTWEDGVKVSWPSDAQSKNPLLGNWATLTPQDLNLNVTCMAENPVSSTSTTVFVKEVCAEERPGTEAPQENETGQSPSRLWIVGVIIAVITILLFIAIVAHVRMKKAAKGSQHFPPRSEIENSPRSDSTLIRDQPKETRRKTNQPARRAAKNNQEMPHTIYDVVQHPKQNPLQTDDEKIQKGRRSHQNQGEKTIYSEIVKPQEREDPAIKTIYDTVQSPLSAISSGL